MKAAIKIEPKHDLRNTVFTTQLGSGGWGGQTVKQVKEGAVGEGVVEELRIGQRVNVFYPDEQM